MTTTTTTTTRKIDEEERCCFRGRRLLQLLEQLLDVTCRAMAELTAEVLVAWQAASMLEQ